MIKYFYNESIWPLDLFNISLLSWLLPLVFALLFKRWKRREHRNIIAFAGFALLLEHVSTDVDIKNLFIEGTNTPWYHLGIPVLFFLMTRFFSVYLAGKKGHYLNIVLPSFFLVISIFAAVYNGGFYRFPTLTIGLYSLSGIILSIGYFIHLLRTLSVERMENEPRFWLSTGLLLYYSANFLLWTGLTFLDYDRDFFYSIYRINAGMTILLNFLFVAALYAGKSSASAINSANLNET